MVAIINSGASLRSTFYYNENKVKEGKAEYILAQNYPLDTDQLDEQLRLAMLMNMAARNPDIKRKSIHISLNFAPEEQPSKEQLQQIAIEYMDKIGFGDQPFLVYQHQDSGHPHIHIVTTKIKYDGSPIYTQNIGRNQSETARKEIEIKYGLVKAEDHKASLFRMRPVDATKVIYGKETTTRAIANVLNAVIEKYKYATLAELNAILNLYNVSAERGSEDSRIYKTGGLVYRILNTQRETVGSPIKASAFVMKPTLKYLESKFLKNDVDRQQYKSKLKSTIDFTLKDPQVKTIEQLSAKLFRQNIRLVTRVNDDQFLYGLTYVDLKNKVVFNGSALGKDYSPKAIQEKFPVNITHDSGIAESIKQQDKIKDSTRVAIPSTKNNPSFPIHSDQATGEKSLLEQLAQSENSYEYLPYELRKTRKKRKKKSNNNL
jgi:hypothetical protein